jgi:autotransporter-associated beta strand protein
VSGLTFTNTSTNGFTLSGGSLLLANGGTIQTLVGSSGITVIDTISTPIQIQDNGGSATFTVGATSTSNSIVISGAVTGVSASGNTTTLNLNGSNTGSSNEITGGIGNGSSGGKLAINKTEAGAWSIGGSNSYSGDTTISAGTLYITSASGLGGTTGTTSIGDGATLFLYKDTMTISDESLSIAGSGSSGDGALKSNGTDVRLGGPITLTGNATINSVFGTLKLTNTGAITGSGYILTVGGATQVEISSSIDTGTGGLIKYGTGKVSLLNNSTYTGATSVNAGILDISTSSGDTSGPLGTTAGGVVVASGAALQLHGTITVGAEALSLNGAGVESGGALRNVSESNTYGGLVTITGNARINSDSGTLTLSNTGTITATTSSNTLTFGGAGDITVNSIIGIDKVIAAPPSTTKGKVTKDGTGTLTLTGSNTYTGLTQIAAGTLKLGAAGNGTISPLGKTNFGTQVDVSATLDLNGYTLSTDEALSLNGFGFVDEGAGTMKGALMNGSSTAATYSGLVTLADSAAIIATSGDIILSNTGTITTPTSGAILYLDGTTSGNRIDSIIGTGTGGLYKLGEGTWTLSGANTYTGDTTIAVGTLQLGNGGETGSLSSSSVIVNDATLKFNRSNILTQGTDFNSVISGSGNVIQGGGGTTILSGANTYTGTTKVNAGVLNVTGSLASGSVVTVGGDGSSGTPTLAGNGTINGATTIAAKGTGVVGIHAPTLKQTFGSSLTYNTGSIFEWDLASSAKGTRGSTYDAVNVAAISGSGAVFKVILGGGGSFSETFWNSDRIWTDIFKTADDGTAVSIAGTFASANIRWFTGSTNMTTFTGGEGYFTTSGTNLNWTAVPEPTSALAGLLLGAGLLRRRRK